MLHVAPCLAECFLLVMISGPTVKSDLSCKLIRSVCLFVVTRGKSA